MGVPRAVAAVGVGVVVLALGGAFGADADPAPGREIPAPFAPFEYLIGSWKGSGVPTANRVRGWAETHAWAWKFEKGTPVGMSVTLQGDRALTKGQIAYDPAARRYLLTGTDPAGKAVSYAGALDKAGKGLTLDRVGVTSAGAKQRLTLTPNANFVRYTLGVLEQEPGAPQYKKVIEAGLTKEGESFAAGGAAADLPKCVVTGGAATLTVSYQGKSFPLCCTGCRDEFNDNPEKYVKKASLLRASGGGASVKAAPAATNKDDGSFDGLGDDPKPRTTPRPSAPGAMKGKAAAPAAAAPPAAKGADPAAKAASLLRLGQNLERARKTEAALTYYRQVARDYPDTPAARSAAARIKALTPP